MRVLFSKKEYIFSEMTGVCQVEDITKINMQRKNYVYYVLRSVFHKEKKSYVPVEHNQIKLRPLISKEEARKRQALADENMEQKLKEEIEFLLGRE